MDRIMELEQKIDDVTEAIYEAEGEAAAARGSLLRLEAELAHARTQQRDDYVVVTKADQVFLVRDGYVLNGNLYGESRHVRSSLGYWVGDDWSGNHNNVVRVDDTRSIIKL